MGLTEGKGDLCLEGLIREKWEDIEMGGAVLSLSLYQLWPLPFLEPLRDILGSQITLGSQ